MAAPDDFACPLQVRADLVIIQSGFEGGPQRTRQAVGDFWREGIKRAAAHACVG